MMISNSQQNIRLPSQDNNSWSDDALANSPQQRPSSPNLFEACYQELEKKGLILFGSNESRIHPMPVNQCCWSATNDSHIQVSSPNPCRHSSGTGPHRSELTTVEIHHCYLYAKSDNKKTPLRQDKIDLHTYENVNFQAYDNFHAANVITERKVDRLLTASCEGKPLKHAVPCSTQSHT